MPINIIIYNQAVEENCRKIHFLIIGFDKNSIVSKNSENA